jgi:hypothetical protein
VGSGQSVGFAISVEQCRQALTIAASREHERALISDFGVGGEQSRGALDSSRGLFVGIGEAGEIEEESRRRRGIGAFCGVAGSDQLVDGRT